MGAEAPLAVDVRVIAATDVDLRCQANRGQFRCDLLCALSELRVRVPALRERREDLPLLLAAMYHEATGRAGALPAELTARLMRQAYPGNVRELRGAVDRAIGEVRARPTPPAPSFDFSLSFREAKEQALAEWTAVYVSALVARFDGNLSRAARTVSMDRNHLRDLLRKYVQGDRS
jgi:DNA-binding NtrC family response regulator